MKMTMKMIGSIRVRKQRESLCFIEVIAELVCKGGRRERVVDQYGRQYIDWFIYGCCQQCTSIYVLVLLFIKVTVTVRYKGSLAEMP